MEKICPLCNKIKDENVICKDCGGIMINIGRVQDYADPYGPQDSINDAENYCIHLFECEDCRATESRKVSKINV